MTEGGGSTVEYSPTWMVAVICAVIITISLLVERALHWAGDFFLNKNNKPLAGAIQKIKEELMLLGFISLLLTVFQDRIHKYCIPSKVAETWLPCKIQSSSDTSNSTTTSHFQTQFFFPVGTIHGRGLEEADENTTMTLDEYCQQRGQTPLLSLTAVHHLHIFIFVLALVHVSVCAVTIIFGRYKIWQWKQWEDSIREQQRDPEKDVSVNHEKEFMKRGTQGWMHSFLKQFYLSVTEAEYYTMRRGFVMTHCKHKPEFDFHDYIMRSFVDDFRKVIGINWFMWLFVVIFLLLNIAGLHTYFWVSFIPFLLLIAVGTKMEHVIAQLAQDVIKNLQLENSSAQDVIKNLQLENSSPVNNDNNISSNSGGQDNDGCVTIKLTDQHFWFDKPKIVLVLIHVLLFQNSFEIAFFFWIWFQYGFQSCMMGQLPFLIPRLVLAVIIVLVCSYSTLPLYAIVTQMGSCYKEAIFADSVKTKLAALMKGARSRIQDRNKSTSVFSRLRGSPRSTGSSGVGTAATTTTSPRPVTILEEVVASNPTTGSAHVQFIVRDSSNEIDDDRILPADGQQHNAHH